MARGPERHHIDKRAHLVAAEPGSDDELLSTVQMAQWLGVSTQWLEIGRHKGHGPPYEKLGARLVRYRRGKARAWLDTRSHQCTSEYIKKKAGGAR